MKTKPILFSTAMVQAILEGRKTQTRRVVKPEPKIVHAFHSDASITTDRIFVKGDGRIHCPYGQPGDILWVRETWCTGIRVDGYVYRADLNANEPNGFDGSWKPSIFMPKEACRLFLKIKSVRVERLNSISESDAIAEGIERIKPKGIIAFKSYIKKWSGNPVFPYASFTTLWQKINGRESWDQNPFVWVVEFEKVDKPNNFI